MKAENRCRRPRRPPPAPNAMSLAPRRARSAPTEAAAAPALAAPTAAALVALEAPVDAAQLAQQQQRRPRHGQEQRAPQLLLSLWGLRQQRTAAAPRSLGGACRRV